MQSGLERHQNAQVSLAYSLIGGIAVSSTLRSTVRYTHTFHAFCTEPDCGDLTHPTNGEVAYNSTNYNEVAIYSCDTGYILTGYCERKCMETSQWSGTTPTCSG